MNEKVRIVLILSLALLASVFTYRQLAGMRETVTVVTASRDIPEGTVIDESMITQVSVGKQDQAILVRKPIREPSQVLGRAPRRPIPKGTVLTLDPEMFTLAPEVLSQVTNGAVPPAYLLPQGMVAIAVPVDAQSSVGYGLQKGDRVNVLFTWKSGAEATSKTVLQQVEVFAVGQSDSTWGGSSKAISTVTLLVSPEDAEKVALAKRTGIVDLALTGR